MVGIELEDLFQHVARRQLNRVALFVVRVVNHLSRRLNRPRHEKYGVLIGTADHVNVGRIEEFVIDVVFDIVARYGLQQYALGQAHAFFGNELVGRRNLAACNPGKVGDHAFDFCDLVVFQPIGELVEVVTHKCLWAECPDLDKSGVY